MPGRLEQGRQRHPRPLEGVSLETGHGLAHRAVPAPRPRFALHLRAEWGSDVFGMYQSMVEGRYVPWDLLVKDVPRDRHDDLDYLIEQLDWEQNVDASFKD